MDPFDDIPSQQDSNSPDEARKFAPPTIPTQSNNKDVQSNDGKGNTYLDDGQMLVEEYMRQNAVGYPIIPYLNAQTNTQQHVTPFQMNEMSSIQKKRKKATPESENKSSSCCNCRNSMCLQLYCECFSAGVFCTDECGCIDCMNSFLYEDSIDLARQKIISRNTSAFAPKQMGQNGASSSSRHVGCNCKQSMCQKNYCECFQAGVSCTSACACESCHNPHGTCQGYCNIVHEAPYRSSSTSNNFSRGSNLSNYNLEDSDLDDESKALYQLFYGNNNNNNNSLEITPLFQQWMSGRRQLTSFSSSNHAPQGHASMHIYSNQLPHYTNFLPSHSLMSYSQNDRDRVLDYSEGNRARSFRSEL